MKFTLDNKTLLLVEIVFFVLIGLCFFYKKEQFQNTSGSYDTGDNGAGDNDTGDNGAGDNGAGDTVDRSILTADEQKLINKLKDDIKNLKSKLTQNQTKKKELSDKIINVDLEPRLFRHTNKLIYDLVINS